MRSDPPPLLPILRSRTQAGVLTVLLLNPDLELTQTELARRVGASLPGEHVEFEEVTAAIATARNLFDAGHRLMGHLALFT